MYASQFIRTETGITPCILAGSNNVWEAGNKRRVRNWSCFRNLVDVSAERLMKEAESMIGSEYQEHWKANNKWVDDAGLMRWMKSKIKGAATVEDIMMAIRYSFHTLLCLRLERSSPRNPDRYLYSQLCGVC